MVFEFAVQAQDKANTTPSLQGCQKVAGGRSVAETTGKQRTVRPHPGVVHGFLTSFQGVVSFLYCPVVFASAATTGYFLTASRLKSWALAGEIPC